MEIGNKIKQLRRQKGYTQQTLAALLHVSCAAISKWENGISYPDISTLPILARIFDVSTDELLNFEKYVSNEEINVLCKEILNQFSNSSFTDAMSYVRHTLYLYPNSEQLKLAVARMYLQIVLLAHSEEEANEVQALAKSLAEDVRHSRDLEKKQLATMLLSNFLSMEQRYDEALQLLQALPKLADTSLMECTLLMQSKDEKAAEQKLQEHLYSVYNQMGLYLLNLCNLARKQQQYEKLADYLNLIEALNQAFRLPLSVTAQLYPFFIALQDEEGTLRSLRLYMEQITSLSHHVSSQQTRLSQSPWFSLVKLNDSAPKTTVLHEHIEALIQELLQKKELSQWPRVQAFLQEMLQKYQRS